MDSDSRYLVAISALKQRRPFRDEQSYNIACVYQQVLRHPASSSPPCGLLTSLYYRHRFMYLAMRWCRWDVFYIVVVAAVSAQNCEEGTTGAEA